LALITGLIVGNPEKAAGQSPLQDFYRAQGAAAASQEAAAAADAARHNNKALKRQYEVQVRQFEKTVIPLTSDARMAWTKVKKSQSPCWQYDIKRTNASVVAVAYFSPKYGYVVNGKFQKNGMGWPTLDEALETNFGEKGLWTLPDIPGWSKAHLLTSDEHIAEMQHQAMEKAKDKAVNKIADSVAEGIAKKVGPRINDQIEKDLGIEIPGQRIGKGTLKFTRLDEDKEKIRYGNAAHGFMIYEFKDQSGFKVLREDGGKGWHKYTDIFESVDDAANFANKIAKSPAPAADGTADRK
jgi:hypothetical protein